MRGLRWSKTLSETVAETEVWPDETMCEEVDMVETQNELRCPFCGRPLVAYDDGVSQRWRCPQHPTVTVQEEETCE